MNIAVAVPVVNISGLVVDCDRPVELGRQREQEMIDKLAPGTVLRREDGSPSRVIVGWNSEFTTLSQVHATVIRLSATFIRVTNSSQKFSVRLTAPRASLAPGESTERTLPCELTIGGRTITFDDTVSDPDALPDEWNSFTMVGYTIAPGEKPSEALAPPPPVSGPAFDQFLGWLRTTLGVLQSAVGATDYLSRATHALVEIIGLQSGGVLLRDGCVWAKEPMAFCPGAGHDGVPRSPVEELLEMIVRDPRPIVPDRRKPASALSSSVDGRSKRIQTGVVASPLLNGAGELIGVLYGELPDTPRTHSGVSPSLTAALVEVLACGISSGLVRQQRERQAERLNSFFGEAMARHIRDCPDLLEPKAATVTVLFCDIRGYSTAAAHLNAVDTVAWLQDVLGALSECVIAEGGVLVDYVGDELLAMWGAPVDQPDQSDRAVRAGLAMLDKVPELSARYRTLLGRDMDIGIGISRGTAQVGNVGSPFKYKYGAIGNTVNVGSRVQGLTKHLKRPILVTRDAWTAIADKTAFAARRVVRAKVVNIPVPVELYEVALATPEKREFFQQSEAALDALESGVRDRKGFALACKLAGTLLGQHGDDGPLQLVLSRGAEALMKDGKGFEPEWVLQSK